MLDPDLVSIIACPETRQPLKLADAELLARLNGEVQAGTLNNVGGNVVDVPLDAALVREDGKIAYPVREKIPVLLIDEGIAL